jgi:hypothetical protein
MLWSRVALFLMLDWIQDSVVGLWQKADGTIKLILFDRVNKGLLSMALATFRKTNKK